MIEQFIQMATQQVGISQGDAEQATSGLLSVLKQGASESDFGSLLSQIGGAEELMNKFDVGNGVADSDGGIMGAVGGLLSGNTSGALGALGGMLGGNDTGAGSIAAVAGLISQLNIDSGQLGSLGSLFFDFVKSQAGESLAQSVMGGLGEFLQNKAA